MDASERMKNLLSALTKNMDDEEVALSVLQGLIAAEIVGHRVKNHMTQDALASQLGVSQSTLSKWESGECNFRLSTLVSIANKLGFEIQSPFVPSPPKTYATNRDNIVQLSSIGTWKAFTYKPDPPTSAGAEFDNELQKM